MEQYFKEYKEKILDSLKKALKDPRSSGAVMALEQIILRTESDGTKVSRLTDAGGNVINSIDDFIALFDVEKSLFIQVVSQGFDRYTATYSGVRVVIRSAVIELMKDHEGDQGLIFDYSHKYLHIAFTLEDRLDNDKEIPLKIAYTTLYKAE